MKINQLKTLLALVLAASTSAADKVVTEVRNFSLGPGETAFGLQFPQYDPAADPGLALVEVTVSVAATFTGEMTFFNETGSAISVTGALGNARVRASGQGMGLLEPAAVELTLSDSASLAADSQLSRTPFSSGNAGGGSRVPATLALYTGTGTVLYDVDFTALYPALVATTPSSAACLLSNERVNGTVTVTYRSAAVPPTAVVLLSFGAAHFGGVEAIVNWRTGVESNLIGFLLDREVGGGDWVRLTPEVIPAKGDGGPSTYRVEDTLPAGVAVARYRLLQVDLKGSLSELGETALVRAPEADIRIVGRNLQLTVRGEPNASVNVQTATDVAQGPWAPVGAVQLDGQGRGSLALSWSNADPARFFRVIVE